MQGSRPTEGCFRPIGGVDPMEAEVPTKEEQLRALLEELGARLLPKFEKHLGSLIAAGYSSRRLLNNATR